MQPRPLPLLASSLLAAAAAAQGGGPGTPGAGGVVPALSISAPELGSVVDVTLEGARPGATVGLAYSPQAGAFALPQGTLWLDPATTVVLFTGVADGLGAATFPVPVPLAAELAEAEVHLQAWAADPTATAGAALSNSLDFRLLGSRLYVGVLEFAVGERLLVKSAVSDADVFLVDSGAASPRPVFGANRALGAVATGAGEVRVFDNFFGDVVHVVPAAGAHERLLGDAAGTGLYVLYDDRVERVELATGQVTGTLPLPTAHQDWRPNATATEAYLSGSALGQPFVRRVDLAGLADLGTVAVGAPGEAIPWIDHAGSTLAVTTTGSLASPPIHGTLHRIDWSGGAPAVATTDLAGAGATGLVAVPAADSAFAWQLDECNPFFAGVPFEMTGASIATPGAGFGVVAPAPPFGAGCIRPFEAAVDGDGVWFVDRCCYEAPDGDEPGALWRLDAGASTWSAPVSLFEGPTAVAVVDDAFSHRVFTAHWGPFPFGGFGAALTAIDAATLGAAPVPFQLALVDVAGDGRTFHGEPIP